MPGANYMGGRRNVMKARAKDSVGRQQKDHFGRQKLDILSKGISATRPSETGRAGLPVSTRNKSSAVDIDLVHAHARTKIHSDGTPSVRSFIPSPIHVNPRTPQSYDKSRMRVPKMHTPNPSVGRSKVLEAVDLSEGLFLRRIADQILAMPNLACLPDRDSARTAPRSKATQVRRVAYKNTGLSAREGKRKTSPLDEDPDAGLSISIKPIFPEYGCGEPFTPPPKKRQRLSSSIADTSSQPSHYQGSKYAPRSVSSGIFTDTKRNSHSTELEFDSDSDSEGIRAILQSSSLWSPDSRNRSSGTSIDDDNFQESQSVAQASPGQIHEYSPSQEDTSEEFIQLACNEETCLPSEIVLGPKTRKYAVSQQTVYGSLFENEDPWSTIGIILGLPIMDSGKNSTNVNPRTSAFVERLSGSPCGKDCETDVDLVQEDEAAEEDEMLNIDWEWAVQSPTSPYSEHVLVNEPEVHENMSITDLTFHANAVHLDSASIPHHEVDIGVDFAEQGSQEMLVRFGAFGKREAVEAEASTSVSPDGKESIRSIVPGSPGGYVTNVDADPGGSARMAGDKILGTPELREEGGRFLGPSLFEDSDESEDE